MATAKKGRSAIKRGRGTPVGETRSRTGLKKSMTEALQEIVGQRKLSAEGVAAALANGAAPPLKTLRDLIDRALATDSATELDEHLWGRDPTEADLARAQANADRAREAALRRTLSDALTREEVAARLGISTQAVSKRTGSDQLVALRFGGRWWYPRWQFTDDDVVPDLHDLVERFASALALTTWVTTPFADLGGVTPAEMLQRRGGQQRVLRLAEATGAEAW